jgi:hypothetical protein
MLAPPAFANPARPWRRAAGLLGACVGLLAAGRPLCVGATTFTDVTVAAGITHVHAIAGIPEDPARTLFFSGGAAAGDFDGDGLVDLVFSRIDAPNVLYRNRGDGTFEPRTTAAGFSTASRTNGVVSGDVDNDGDLDLYMTTVGGTRNFLYLNDGRGLFVDAGTAHAAALANGQPRSGHGASFGDYDGDGYLDLATGDWGNQALRSQSRLLRNRGAAAPGQFIDVTAAAGIDAYRKSYSFRFTPRFADLDRDGRADLTFTADFVTSQLFWNQGDGSFVDGTAAAGVGTDPNGMGAAFGDYDGDGDLDWFITCTNNNPQSPVFGGWNRLFRNEGNRQFTDVTEAAGVRDSGWGWGASFFDYDNDGDLDLAATNGYNGPGWQDDQTRLFRNDGGTFVDASTGAGIVDRGQGRGLLHLDYDADGDIDLLVVNNDSAPVLYRNDGGNEHGWLRVAPQGTASNRDGIGAWITVTPDRDRPERKLVWEIDGGSSYLSQSERTAHFGLGAHSGLVDQVEIEWPSGIRQRFENVPANQTLRAVEPRALLAADFNFDGDVDGDDLAAWAAGFGRWSNAQRDQGDADGDGRVGGRDLLLWQRLQAEALSTAPQSTMAPEPASWACVLAAAATGVRRRRTAIRRLTCPPRRSPLRRCAFPGC